MGYSKSLLASSENTILNYCLDGETGFNHFFFQKKVTVIWKATQMIGPPVGRENGELAVRWTSVCIDIGTIIWSVKLDYFRLG